jgi:HPt (histidine-containing phosphotransfer) domain-containing protein
MDGFSATTELRRIERDEERARLPIIALTANAVQGYRRRCEVAGMDDYLGKPHTQDELRAVLERWVPRSIVPVEASPTASAETRRVAVAEERPGPAGRPGSGASAAGDVLDGRILEQIRQLQRPGEPDLLRRVIDTFLDNADGMIETLRDEIAARDAEGVRRAAHALKSSAANVGAARLSAVFKEIEARGRVGDLGGIEELAARLETAYPETRGALERVREEGTWIATKAS